MSFTHKSLHEHLYHGSSPYFFHRVLRTLHDMITFVHISQISYAGYLEEINYLIGERLKMDSMKGECYKTRDQDDLIHPLGNSNVGS